MCIFVYMIFLTGGTGLVGSHILMMLIQDNISVKALKRSSSRLEVCRKVFSYHNLEHKFGEIQWCDGDINDIISLENHMKDCETIVHAAALVSFNKSDLEILRKVNIEGTANVMNTALNFKYKRCIYISSVATLSREINFQNVDESCYFEPHKDTSNYAFTKYYAEQEVWRASNEGIDVVILNPSIILGPGDWDKGSSKIFQRIFNGLKFYSTGSSGYVDVIDVAQIAKSLIFSNIKNERFILNGINIKFKEAFNLIADELNVERAHIKVTPFLKELAWRLEIARSFLTGNRPLLTKETANSAMKNVSYSSEKVKEKLKYEFISFDKTVKDCCRFYKQDLV